MMIAYNLCYSTCLGKFDPRTGGTSGRLGVVSYSEERTAAGLARASEAHKAWLESRDHVDHDTEGKHKIRTKVSKASAGEGVRTPRTPREMDTSDKGDTPSSQSSSSGEMGKEGRRLGGGMSVWDPHCIHIAPNTAGFCHPSLRQGILPLMLREILETRVMIKGAMRRAEEAKRKVLARTLNARQFALKMISNVTYGYAENFH